jgi:hypothetical protein
LCGPAGFRPWGRLPGLASKESFADLGVRNVVFRPRVLAQGFVFGTVFHFVKEQLPIFISNSIRSRPKISFF